MKDEYIDIVDANGKFTGQVALKNEAHKQGWYHNTTHVWIYNRSGEILLAQRSLEKKIHPGLWDVSSAGHVDSGETILDAALRELEEELGIVLPMDNLIKIGIFKHETVYGGGAIRDFEFHHAFIVQWTGSLDILRLQPGEVDDVKWVNPDTFKMLLEDESSELHFIKSNRDYYLKVLDSIKDQLESTNN